MKNACQNAHKAVPVYQQVYGCERFSMYPDADWFIRNISGGMEIDRFLLFQQGSLRITFLIAIIMVS